MTVNMSHHHLPPDVGGPNFPLQRKTTRALTVVPPVLLYQPQARLLRDLYSEQCSGVEHLFSRFFQLDKVMLT